jgi:hypothetical protein
MKKTLCLILAALMMLSLCACGESSSQAARSEAKAANGYAMADEAYYAEEPMYEPAPEADYTGAYGLSATQTAGGTNDAPSQRPGKIIYSSNVRVETTDFDGTLSKLDAMVTEYGGWVESSSINGTNYSERSRGAVSRRSASYTLRIPSDRFQELMGSLSELGNIPYSYVYTENVTAQYYDVQARLTAYTAQEQRLLEMMEMAETVEDVILLEDRLTEVRYQIEALQSTLNNWDRQVSFSSVYLDISEVQEYSPEPQIQPSYGQQLKAALQEGLHDTGAFFKGLLLALTGALPALLVLAVLTVVVVLLVKRGRKKRKAAREAARAARSAPAPIQPASDPPEAL